MTKPFSLGFNGHAKSCTCDRCADSHASHVEELWEANGKFARPKSDKETVFVRSYFRRQPNHFAKKPNFRVALAKVIKNIRKEA